MVHDDDILFHHGHRYTLTYANEVVTYLNEHTV